MGTFDSPESSKASISAKGKRKKLIKKQKERNTNDIDSSTEIDDVPEKRERGENKIAPRKENDKYFIIKSQNELTENEKKEKEKPAFAVTLKKTQMVKQPIEEQKLEVVLLKHHDFEINPQQPVDEQISNVRLTLSVAEGEESLKTKKKLSKKKLKTKDTYDDLGEKSEVSESRVKDKKVSEDSIMSKIIDTAENSNENDDKNKSMKIKEKIEEAVQVSSKIPKEQKKGTKMEIMDQESDMPSEQKEVQKRKVTLKKINIDEQKKAKQESEKPIEPIFERKLKKTETVKMKIKENKMEKVVLKHHEFELQPKEIIDEENSIKDEEPKIKSKKQIKKKKMKKPLQIVGN